MIRNDPDDFAQRFYARVPDSYRAYDAQEGYPLLALLSAAGYQAAAIRRDLDDLWNDFFIESCADWVVPYIGALLGTELLPDPVGQTSRLEVWKTIGWRRSRGTPAMLREMASATTGWKVAFAEFFTQIGWSQNLDHLRLARALTPDLRDPARLARLGHADDPFAHAIDVRPAGAFDGPRVTLESNGVPVAAWGTPGRYLTTNVGYFASPLQAFAVRGATPAAAEPGLAAPPNACAFTFDPLFRELPLFSTADARPIARAAHAARAWPAFGHDLGVREHGVLLATDVAPASAPSGCTEPFTFGGRADGFALDASAGMRVLLGDVFGGSPDFGIDAIWFADSDGSETVLGTLRPSGFTVRETAPPGTGTLALNLWSEPVARVRRFPGGTIAVRAARASGGLHEGDGVFVAMPARYVAPGGLGTLLYVAADGTVHDAPLPGGSSSPCAPAVYPRRAVTPSAVPAKAADFIGPHGPAGTPVLADPSRLGGLSATLSVGPHGAGAEAALTVTVAASAQAFLAATEWAVPDLAGGALLIYVPEIADAPGAPTTFVVAEDGSTYVAPPTRVSLGASALARAALGQTLPIAGAWPFQQRVPLAVDTARAAYVPYGALGIDPERGRIVLANGDPSVGSAALSVDYAEGFTARVGAFASSQVDASASATIIVSSHAVANVAADVKVVPSLADAFAAATGTTVVIEIADSRTYASATPLTVPAEIDSLTVRAAQGARPTLAFYDANGAPTTAGIIVASAMQLFELDGVILSGGPLTVTAPVASLRLNGSALDPRTSPSLVVKPIATALPFVSSPPSGTVTPSIGISSCVTGALQIDGAAALQIADAIVDARGGDAIAAANAALTLDRVTVFGRVACLTIVASDTLLDDVAIASDRQTGYLRFTRYEPGSALPSAFASTTARPSFESRRWGRPDYARLAVRTPEAVSAGSDRLAEVGAFASRLDTVRLANLARKTEEFLPAALSAIAIAET